jgi:hypothetical protein
MSVTVLDTDVLTLFQRGDRSSFAGYRRSPWRSSR